MSKYNVNYYYVHTNRNKDEHTQIKSSFFTIYKYPLKLWLLVSGNGDGLAGVSANEVPGVISYGVMPTKKLNVSLFVLNVDL